MTAEGVHAPEGVAFLARMSVHQLPSFVCFGDPYFSEPTAFVRTSDKSGYYMVSMNECSCPDFRSRMSKTGDLCEHQRLLVERLERKARIDARNKERAIQRAQQKPLDLNQRVNFSMPEEGIA